MSKFTFARILVLGGGGAVVYFRCGDETLSVRLSENGRLIAAARNGLMLHNRNPKGGPRLPSSKMRKCRDYACAAVAARALGRPYHLEFDL